MTIFTDQPDAIREYLERHHLIEFVYYESDGLHFMDTSADATEGHSFHLSAAVSFPSGKEYVRWGKRERFCRFADRIRAK